MKKIYNLLESKKLVLVYIPLIFYWLLILALTSIPSNSLPTGLNISDKLNHLMAYFGLAVLLNLTLHFQMKWEISLWKGAILTLIIASLYGILDEWHQNYIPGRFAEVADWVANFLGALLGVIFTSFIIYEGRSINNNREQTDL